MHVVIAHNAVPPNARADESDVLRQVSVVRDVLTQLGHTFNVVAVDLNLQACAAQLRALKPDVVFNLVESLAGSDRLASLAVGVIESFGILLSGSCAESLWLTNHKILAKQKLKQAGLPTPEWYDPESDSIGQVPSNMQVGTGDLFILKPVGEHASFGMDQSSVVRPEDFAGLNALLQQRNALLGRPCFAERFISGREFNVSLLADGESCQVLPLAEIDFSAFPPEKARIVDYQAKWDERSFEFQHTPRHFLDSHAEHELSQRLSQLARNCWSVFRLGGYARVDFRIDEAGQPWILEINTNPCLSPDAGFAAALEQARIGFSQAVQRILIDALRKQPAAVPAIVSDGTATTTRVDTRPTEARSGKPPDEQPRIEKGILVAASLRDARPPSGEVERARAARLGETRPRKAIGWRFEVTARDPGIVRELVAQTEFFYPDEVAVAEELVQERLAKGAASGYHFVFAEIDDQVAGYACYGHIACTRDSYDLYWIAVHPRHQGQGIGRLVLAESERCIQALRGRRVYIETSNREQYQSTRGFYLRCGYECEATLIDFYGPGDDKVIYVKSLG